MAGPDGGGVSKDLGYLGEPLIHYNVFSFDLPDPVPQLHSLGHVSDIVVSSPKYMSCPNGYYQPSSAW